MTTFKVRPGVSVAGGPMQPSNAKLGDVWVRDDGTVFVRDLEMKTVPVPTWKVVREGLSAIFEEVSE